MANATYARRYAQAALELGIEHGDLEVWEHDLALLGELWKDADRRAYFEDVRAGKQERLKRVREHLGEHLSPRVLNMVLLLVTRGRTSLIPYIVRHFADLERQRDQQVVAHVTAACELSAEEQSELRSLLETQTGKKVELETEVNPDILGGLIIKVEDQLLDLSVVGKLNRMRSLVIGRRT
jgi:F-type H+-transporting ATPase subunit delta